MIRAQVPQIQIRTRNRVHRPVRRHHRATLIAVHLSSACSSSTGNESNSSSDDERESDDIDAGTKYRIASEKYERVSSRDSGRSSSFSFASKRLTDMKKKRKSRGKRLRKTKKSSSHEKDATRKV